ncbi:MAG: siderophore-interacting protein, partial [Pseudomonadota bacterium]
MSKALREVSVARLEPLSSHMLRIGLTGASLDDFPQGFEGGYVKLMFPAQGDRPIARSYTVRSFTAELNELVIDCALRDHAGRN